MKKKLYIKGKCSICRGRILSCPYCDSDGLTFIEAADNLIVDLLKEADQELKEKIKEALKD